MAIARAERLINRRLARYWGFLGAAYLTASFLYLLYTSLHGFYSSYSGTIGAISPRFLLSIIGLFYLVIFLFGTIFLAFEIRARDCRDRFAEVLDSRPYSNLELVAGRFLGVLLCTWIPIVVLVILFELLGITMKHLGLPFGEPMEILSVFSFIFMMAVPALSFIIALAFLITLLVKNRLVAAVILFSVTGILYWALFYLPAVYGELFDIVGISATVFCSETVPRFAYFGGWIQRFSVLFAAFSLLGFSAAVHPRLDGGSRLKLAAGSLSMLVVAFFFSGIMYYMNDGYVRMRDRWKDAHNAANEKAVPDLKKITGNVKILPGKDLFLELDIVFGAPTDKSIESALFTLNPGQQVIKALDDSGESIGYKYKNGLLELTLSHPLAAGEVTTVHLSINGVPDNRFAFLESAFDINTLRGVDSQDIGLFGIDTGMFHKDFVALMPGLRWLPVSGPEKKRDDPRLRTVDFFQVDLVVNLPKEWLVAGPGRRHKAGENPDETSYRFSPLAPVPEVALIASRFESRAIEIEGVTLEILLDKKHIKNIEVLTDAKDNLSTWAGNLIRETEEYGLGYPYDALTLVEIPNYMRTYGGGWRMDTVTAPPGMLLMREAGFPTARFDTAFRNPERFNDSEGGIQKAKWERVKTFFINDLSGGNLFSGAARNFFMYQTSAEGPEGLALNYIMESLSNLLITSDNSYFSAHQYLGGDALMEVILMNINAYNREPVIASSIVGQAVRNAVSRPEVWDQVLGIPLKDIDPWEAPALTVDVLTLKANGIAQSILDTLGSEKTGQFLASIRENHKGESFTINDVLEAGKTLGYDLSEILGERITGTELPGFVCDKSEIYRIQDSEDGTPRYQILFTVRNDEPVPGFFKFLFLYMKDRGGFDLIRSEPIHMDGKSIIQYGNIVSTPPAHVFVEPYLSLNRNSFKLKLDNINQEKIEEKAAIEGVDELPYSITQDTAIVIDDLDSGFSVIEEKDNNGLRLVSGEDKQISTDQGLPLTSQSRISQTWSRVVYTTSFGKYRHTVAVVGGGKGEKKAVFKADINKAGEWNLEIHLPFKPRIMPGKKWGTYHLVITDNSGAHHEIAFNSKSTFMGWNPAGSIFLPEGETTVMLSNKTDGEFVVADAVRWTPSAGK
jgi:hypothetical protein